jgi:predicted RNA-binding protein with PUA-like domain
MAHWLMKSEPSAYSWQQLEKDGRTNWSGVRNFQASNNLKAMKLDDRAFFYHSNEGLDIVGIMTIVKEYYPDPSDESGRFGMVDVAPLRAVPRPVTLAAIKAEPKLADFLLVRHSRLSVVPVDAAAWKLICKMGGVAP